MSDYSTFAQYYDLDQGEIDNNELEFYLRHLRKNNYKSFIEYGCGTGRLLIPLSISSEVNAFGLDKSYTMLMIARKKSVKALANTQLFCINALHFRSHKMIDMAIASNNFLYEFESNEMKVELLLSMQKITKKRVIIDVFNPAMSHLDKLNGWERKLGAYVVNNDLISLFAKTIVILESQKIITNLDYQDSTGKTLAQAQIEHNYLFSNELLDLVKGLKWKNLKSYGDYNLNSFVEDESKRLLIIGDLVE